MRNPYVPQQIACFSPLAGIRYAETETIDEFLVVVGNVSVPLRGLDMRKL